MKNNSLKVNFERLKSDLLELSSIGRSEQDNAIFRPAFSAADFAARNWLLKKLAECGVEGSLDGAGNVCGRLTVTGDSPTVLCGSHLDSVPGGGSLDGALGVIVALEALRRIKELDLKLARPLELVGFSDEEGRFGGSFGSQALGGHLSAEMIESACDLNGVRLVDAMSERGLIAAKALQARRSPESLAAFLELHIEQGPVLDSKKIDIGLVETVVGLFKWRCILRGQADHAGTTPMSMRRDALRGVGDFLNRIDSIIEKEGSPDSVATVGRVELTPGSANVVPGEVIFSLDVRDRNAGNLAKLARAFEKILCEIASQRGLSFEVEILSEVAPVDCEAGMVARLEELCGELNLTSLRMVSGAAHDAQMVAKIAPVAVIFVPSVDGRSHSPLEFTNWKDIENGANLTLRMLIELATLNTTMK